jgi:esterase
MAAGRTPTSGITVLLQLSRPALAIDLPGHGHSLRREVGDYGAVQNAALLAQMLPQMTPEGCVLVGNSLGALTAIALANQLGGWIRKVVLVDATPRVSDEPVDRSRGQERGVAATERLDRYDSFEALLDVAVALNPRRPLPLIRRDTRLNAMRLAEGDWTWRHDTGSRRPSHPANWPEMRALWDEVSALWAPLLLARAEHSRFVSDDNERELRARLPSARVDMVLNSGRPIQSDQPLVLAGLIEDFCF